MNPTGILISSIGINSLKSAGALDARKVILAEGFNNINHGYICDHLVGTYTSTTVPQGSLGLLFTSSLGTSVTITSLIESGISGIQRLTSGSAVNNAGLLATPSCIYFNLTSTFSCRFRFRLPVLPISTNNFTFRLGFQNDPNQTPVNGIAFLYDGGDSRFKGAVFKDGVLFITGNSIALVANTFYNVEIVVITQIAYFFVNDVFLGSINEPTAFPNGKLLKLMATIIKLSGASNHQLDLDYISYGWGG
ncbi:MAG: hypothetical protein ACRC80_24995 [Waterburya sp.]